MESPMTMTTIHSRPAVVSPRVPEPTLARYPAATRAPQPHTAAELDRLIRMLGASRAETIAIGHGRHTASAGAADAILAHRGLRRMVGRTGPDPGSLAAGRPSDVGQDHLPRLALAALPVHAIGQEIIARRDGRSRLAATARAALAAT
jgi:hypothetical protein